MSAKNNTPEENEQSQSMLSNPDQLQPETCNPPSPDLTVKRRKLGSRRKNKERQHVKDSTNESYHIRGEEVEETTKSNEALETTPLRPESQEGLNQGSKHDVSVTHDGSLYLASMSGYSCEVENLTTSCSEDISESLSPKNGNQQGGKDENETGSKVTSNSCGLVETVKEETSPSEEVIENAHTVADSDLISSGPLSSEPLGVYSATEAENKEWYEDTDLFRQDGANKGNDLMNESHVESVDTTAEGTSDENNPRQTECSIEHGTLPKEEITAAENQIEGSSLPLDGKPQDSSVCVAEQVDTDFHSTVNRRKLGSSRRNKRQQPVKDYVAESNRETNEEVDESVRGYEVFETTKLSSLMETSAKVKLEGTVLEEIDKSDTHQIEKLSGQAKEITHLVGISESMTHELPSVYSLMDAKGKENKDVNVLHGKSDDLGPECQVEQAIDSPPKEELSTNEEQEEHFSSSEVRGAEDDESKVHAEELEPAEMQEIFLNDSTESVTHQAAENSEICFANLADQTEVGDSDQAESSVKGTAPSATEHGLSNLDDKQEKHPTEEGNKEPLDQINEEYAYDHQSPQTSDIEIVDTAVSDQKKERLDSQVTESESPTQTPQSGAPAPFDSPQDNAAIIDEKNNSDFNPTRNRKKMGSSRRIKGRQNVRGPAPESEMSLTIETAVQEISTDNMLEGNDKPDPSQTEDISDTIMEDAHASTTMLPSISAHSSPPGDQQVIEQSNSEQMPEEPASMFNPADTESNELDEGTDLLRQWGILQAGSLVNETRLPSESDESSVTPEITTEKNNHREHTEPECGVEQATVSSPKEEMSAMEEQNEHFGLSEVRGARHTQDAAEEVRGDEVEPTQMQTMHQIDSSSTKESKSSLQTLQSDTKSHLDSQPMDRSLSIEEETPSSFKPSGNRRKLGSSRRCKVKQDVPEPVTEPKEEFVVNTSGDRASDNEKMQLATETTGQEVSKEQSGPDLKPTEKTRKIRSAVKEEENIDQTPDRDTALSQNVVDSGNTVTTDFIVTSDICNVHKSSEEVNEVEEKLVKEREHLTPRTGSDEMDLVQSWKDDSDTQNISYHDDAASNRPVAYDLLCQEEVFHVQNTQALSRDTDSPGQEMNIQRTNYEKETVGNVPITDHSTEAEASMDAQGPGRVEVGEEECKDPATKDLAAQVSHPQPFSGAQNKTETLASFDIGHEENLRAMPSVNVPEERGISTAVDSSNSQQELPERPPEDFRSGELQTNRQSMNPLSPPNAEGTDSGVTVSFWEAATGTQNDEQSPEGVKVIRDQASKSTESPSYVVAESVAGGGAGEQQESVQAGAQESTKRRRKMGSTRRSLGSRSKVKDQHEKQEVDDNEATATTCGDVLTEGVSGISSKEPQLHEEQKDGDSERRRERVFETVELRHTGESQVKPFAQQTVEETPDSVSQRAETEHHLAPDHPPAKPTTSPRHNDVTELAAGGRRRKMGSHRRSHGHQRYNDPPAREDRGKYAEQGGDAVSLTDERDTETRGEDGEEPSGMDRIPEVDESSNISSSNRTDHSRALRAPERESPVQHPRADAHLRPERQKFSLADSRGADVRSKHFNVLLIGNSSVGKTSFMKRANSGTFSLDLDATVGLDCCMWTVAVGGKPVVLRLWDTAGQERFHSITTQVFHKAQAFLLMYDVTSPQSFSAISYWANCIQEGAADDVTVLLLGNKSDCGERQVKTQEGEFLAKNHNFEFIECSAATGENVIHSLETVARMLSQMVDTREEAMVLHKEPPQKKRSGCC